MESPLFSSSYDGGETDASLFQDFKRYCGAKLRKLGIKNFMMAMRESRVRDGLATKLVTDDLCEYFSLLKGGKKENKGKRLVGQFTVAYTVQSSLYMAALITALQYGAQDVAVFLFCTGASLSQNLSTAQPLAVTVLISILTARSSHCLCKPV